MWWAIFSIHADNNTENDSLLFYSQSNCVDCELIGYGLIKQLHALPDGFITRMATAHNAQRIPSRNEPGRRFVQPVLWKLCHRPVLSSNRIVCFKCTYSSTKHWYIRVSLLKLQQSTAFEYMYYILYIKIYKSEIKELLNNNGIPLSYISRHILINF